MTAPLKKEFLTLEQAAEELSYSKRHIQDLIAEGILAAHGSGKGVRVIGDSIEQLKAEAFRKAEDRRAEIALKRATHRKKDRR